MNPAGGLMGLPASDRNVGMRIVDMYRRDGDKLAENWIFIDILYFLMQQDVDVLERSCNLDKTAGFASWISTQGKSNHGKYS
jgi:hypothetical protein